MHVPDHDRLDRIGMPEAVLCSSKSDAQLRVVVSDLAARARPCLLTRLAEDRLHALPAELQRPSRLRRGIRDCGHRRMPRLPTRAGRHRRCRHLGPTRLRTEASRTLTFCGIDNEQFLDIGVSGLWRLEQKIGRIRQADVAIVVAGMDAALVSVLGGLVSMPVIAVPTSVGYGVASGGSVALNSAARPAAPRG